MTESVYSKLELLDSKIDCAEIMLNDVTARQNHLDKPQRHSMMKVVQTAAPFNDGCADFRSRVSGNLARAEDRARVRGRSENRELHEHMIEQARDLATVRRGRSLQSRIDAGQRVASRSASRESKNQR